MFLLTLHNQRLWLSPARCIFWEEEKILILSDLHIGKVSHFRKAGLAIPQGVFHDDLDRLSQQIQYFNPSCVLITGDLFHSSENTEHQIFANWRACFSSIKMILVRGNHEILPDKEYESLGLDVRKDELNLGKFSFSHEIPNDFDKEKFYFTGHIHPSVRISGKGKQSFVFPCFHFKESYCVMPAFSKFTGFHFVEQEKNDKIFAVVSDKKEKNSEKIFQL